MRVAVPVKPLVIGERTELRQQIDELDVVALAPRAQPAAIRHQVAGRLVEVIAVHGGRPLVGVDRPSRRYPDDDQARTVAAATLGEQR